MNEKFINAYFAQFLHGRIFKYFSDKIMNRPGLRNKIENIKHAEYLEYGVKQTALKMPILKCSVLTSDTTRRGEPFVKRHSHYHPGFLWPAPPQQIISKTLQRRKQALFFSSRIITIVE